jgi:hypothetical protein
MKASKLIESLQKGIELYGDLDVSYLNANMTNNLFQPINHLGYNFVTKEFNLMKNLYPTVDIPPEKFKFIKEI